MCYISAWNVIHTKGTTYPSFTARKEVDSIVLACPLLHNQMVRLYRDPEGETVFTAHEEALQVTAVLGGPQAQLSECNRELDGLRKKVKQLEDTIVEYKVCINLYLFTLIR